MLFIVQNDFAQFLTGIDGKFYILPSSIHELIVIPAKATESVDGLKELVRALNESNMPREEWLSESVYQYKDGEAGIA